MSTSDMTTSDMTRRVRGGRLIAVMIGALLATAGGLGLAAGGVMVLAHQTLRDADGFYRTPTARVKTSTAVIMSPLNLGSPSDDDGWMLDRSLPTLSLRASAVDQGALFVGIAPADAVQRWLGTSAYERVTGVSSPVSPGGHYG